MRVPLHLSLAAFDQASEDESSAVRAVPGKKPDTMMLDFPGARPKQEKSGGAVPQTAQEEKVKALHAALMGLVTKHDEATAPDVLNGLLGIVKQAAQLKKEIGPSGNQGLINRLDTICFKTSRIAVHLFRSLTPEGKEKNRPLVRQILDYTPHLRKGHKREHFAGDDELRRFQYSKGNLEHGRKLGLEKQRLGMTEADFGRRQAALAQRRAEARRQGRALREDETGEIFGPPGRGEDKRAPGAGAPTPPSPEEKKQKVSEDKKRRTMAGWLGYLGQDIASPEISNYLNQQESEFRPADVEKKAEILDKIASLNEAANAGLSPQDAIKVAEETGAGISLLAIGLGVVAVGAILYFIFKKK